jgi:integrase/recombinase XerC
LLHDLALRRGEVCSLDLQHVDLPVGTVSILGKGRSERETLTLPPATIAALAQWVECRGTEPGPLLWRLDRAATRPARLSGTSVWSIVSSLGRRAGLARPTWPHALRHQAVTQALTVTGGDLYRVQKFSRHQSFAMVKRYDDARLDDAGTVAKLVAAEE